VPVLISTEGLGNGKVVKFSEKECAKGRLETLQHGYELMPKLIELIKK
jgi:2,3-bisphosphoglycerate-independent phosphoglycerate mutase